MPESQSKPSRRGFIMGAAVAGAAGAAVVALPQVQKEAEAPATEARPKPERGGGYHVSEHVKRYYRTTLV